LNESTLNKPLRVWPGVVIVLFQWVARYGVPMFVPEALPFGAMAGLASGLAIVVWWVLFSRAPWSERLGAIVLMAVALVATSRLLHVSVETAGQGYLFPMYAVPLLSLAFVVWAMAARRLSDGARRIFSCLTASSRSC
jgi:hypothetical protein